MELDDIKTTFWTDSTTVLAWVGRCESWDAYVYNRIREIREITCGQEWRHVPGGASWLSQSEKTWLQPKLTYNEEEINSERKKNVVSALLNSNNLTLDWYYRWFSQYKKIVKSIGWMLKFFNNSKIKQHIKGELIAQEYNAAEIRVLLLVQQEAFDGVFNKTLKTLLPFTDEDGPIRIKTKVPIGRIIEWRFNPPVSLGRDGWFENEEMATILCDCELVINNRPLTYLSQDSSDLALLTPSLSLQEVEEIGVPDIDLIESTHLNRRLRYRQHLKSTPRKRFRTEYLGQLNLFSAKGSQKELSVGEIVLIVNDHSKRIDWPLARITEAIKGKDGYVRVVKLKTGAEELIRLIERVYPLELELKSDGVKLLVNISENQLKKMSPWIPV
ncbi:hypothetical protein ILUMI_21421 [Ignelater luminosus]|uniref:DUF5641 domain-containing protein n=1 Tax=Ignelater luminosus TaxID=2038154 RepID=A0A8K0G3K9_IGNLU|nr:hypothetical protein ILUMI_21421 [Ignelater luminosus]